jgi:methyl-accepting chemotaxis protein
VVAREIRNLSRETERSLAEIEKLTNEIRNSITQMVEKAKNANESISSEKNALISVAGSLQGAVLGVEVIRTVSGVAQEKSAEQQAILGTLKELSGAFRDASERIGAELSRADEITSVLRTLTGPASGR